MTGMPTSNRDDAATVPATGMALILQNAELLAQAVTPLLPPNVQLALTTGTLLLNAVQHAMAQGADLTDGQLAALFKADDLASQAQAAAEIAMQAKS